MTGKNMRRGYSLVEMLIVLVVFASVSAVFAGLFRTLLRDIPVMQKNYQTNTSIQHLLDQMRSDVDAAVNISLLPDENQSLLLENNDGTVRYQLAESKVLRKVSGSTENIKTWSLPKAAIEWKVWKKNELGYAVQVHTAVEYIIDSRTQGRLAGSHLFFAGTLAGTGIVE